MKPTRYGVANGISFGDHDFHGPVSESRVEAAEAVLQTQFPPSYRDFLLHFGAIRDTAGLPGPVPQEEINPWLDVVEITRQMQTDLHGREQNLHLLYIESDGGDHWYCLDLSQVDSDGESPVILYGPDHDSGKVIARNFFEFLKLSWGTD